MTVASPVWTRGCLVGSESGGKVSGAMVSGSDREVGAPSGPRGLPLYVDLDGTLIRTDVLQESIFAAIRADPWVVVRIPGWLLRGREVLKAELAGRVGVDPALLPYNGEVVEYVRRAREEGRRTVLATASHRSVAEAVAAQVGLFDAVMGSDRGGNLKGHRKLASIEADSGGTGFEYLGDSRADLPIYAAARSYGVVGGGAELPGRPPAIRFGDRRGWPERARAMLRLMRPHQWCKNALILAPVVAGQRLLDGPVVGTAMLAVVVFSLLASAVYVLNDLFDISSDRGHPRKRTRPLASAALMPAEGAVLAAGLLVLSGLLSALLLPPAFTVLAAVYLLVNVLYSTVLKRKAIVDVLCLAGLYTLRILAGGAACGIVLSPWLLAFSMFLFLSLAFVKRYTELIVSAERDSADRQAAGLGPEGTKVAGRGYFRSDVELIRSVGPTSGYLAVLVLALYVSAPEVSRHYSTPEILYGLSPLVLYWITRVWFLAQRRMIHDDPVVFALTDRMSWVTVGACGVVLLAAKFM